MPVYGRKLKLTIVFVLFVAVAGCSAQGGGLGGLFGQVVTTASSAAGAYGGSRIGHGVTPYIMGPVGAVVGAWVGSSMVSILSQSGQQLMTGATQRAAQSGQAQNWSDPSSGSSGRAEVIQQSTLPQPATTAAANNFRPCRTIGQSVMLRDGSRYNGQVTACPGANGWAVK